MQRTASDDGTDGPVHLGRRLALTAKSVRAYTDGRLVDAGASLSKVLLGRAIAAEPGLSQRALAERIGVQAPTVLRHLDRMEDEGLVDRRRDPTDRRVQRVTLTAAGSAALAKMEEVASAADDATTAVFDAKERATLERLLDRLARHVDGLRQEEADR